MCLQFQGLCEAIEQGILEVIAGSKAQIHSRKQLGANGQASNMQLNKTSEVEL
jgi:hypothetical protein